MRTLCIFTFLFFTVLVSIAGELRVKVNSKPLDEVLRSLPVSISFDASAVSAYKITLNKTYANIDQALTDILRGKSLKWTKSGDVYIIIPVHEPPKTKHPVNSFKIVLADKQTHTSLPYASVSLNSGQYIADDKGMVSFKTAVQFPLNLRISSLGYKAVDTVLTSGTHHIYMQPEMIQLKDITVWSNPDAVFMQAGRKAGEINLNQRIAPFMAGSRDNSVFGMLRMMPGVRASGEAQDELMVWGSTGGESTVYFDGIHLFGMRAFNNQIGYVNPYLVSGIRLQKTGGSAEVGGQTGALAEIIAPEGNTLKAEYKAALNNTTANVYASLPLFKNAVLTAAMRKSVFNSLRSTQITTLHSDTNSYFVNPDYSFHDANIRLSGRSFENDNYSVAFYYASDRLGYNYAESTHYSQKGTELSAQKGISVAYNKVWEDGSGTRFQAAFSKQVLHTASESQSWQTSAKNSISEKRIGLNHTLNLNEKQILNFGAQVTSNQIEINNSVKDVLVPSVYTSDRITLGKLFMEAGLRLDYNQKQISGNRWYLQPRFNASFRIKPSVTVTLSYNEQVQYLARQAVLGFRDSVFIAWTARTENPLRASLATFGVSGLLHGWQITSEFFYKTQKNALRLFNDKIIRSDIRSLGMDFSVRRNIGDNRIFASYSVLKQQSEISELTHELKGGILLHWKNFYFSTNYVHGLGFLPQTVGAQNYGFSGSSMLHLNTESYSRLDVGFTYNRHFRFGDISTGISLLNLFNTINTRYNYYVNTNNHPVIFYTRATPFTPLFFIELKI